MSGFEVVGLILALYPMIADVLALYQATKAGRTAKRLLRSVTVEEVVYGQFVHALLATELSIAELARLRNDDFASVDFWRDEKLNHKLSTKLGSKSTELVLETLQNTNELLISLKQEILELVHNDQNDRTAYGRMRNRMNSVRHNFPLSGINQRLKQLMALNGTLQRLLCDGHLYHYYVEADETPPPIKYLRRDCSHVVNLYHALKCGFRCECAVPHSASLMVHRLEDDLEGKYKDRHFVLLSIDEEEQKDDLNSVTEGSWSQISPIEQSQSSPISQGRKRRMSSISICEGSETDPAEALEIPPEGLCSVAKRLDDRSFTAKESLSVSGSEQNYILSMTSHREDVAYNPSALSLDSFLRTGGVPPSREERMQLALHLSHAVLQFYTTPWIDECWTWRNFTFAEHNRSQLFVAHNFYSALKLPHNPLSREHAIHSPLSLWREPILTRLGFALIELALGARLADLRAEGRPELASLDWSLTADNLDFATARQLLRFGSIKREEGQAYEAATEACLEHQFMSGSRVRGLRSDQPSFQDDVEKCILIPLHTLCKTSWGQA